MHKSTDQQLLEQTKLLVARLERLSADSLWAHRSSGARGELLRWQERLDEAGAPAAALTEEERGRLETLIRRGFWLLEKAAQELL